MCVGWLALACVHYVAVYECLHVDEVERLTRCEDGWCVYVCICFSWRYLFGDADPISQLLH